jgi:hypothetical protein
MGRFRDPDPFESVTQTAYPSLEDAARRLVQNMANTFQSSWNPYISERRMHWRRVLAIPTLTSAFR